MTHRYFSETPITGDSAVLADTEAHHLMHVMRAKAGDEVVLFDGTGAEFVACVRKVGRGSVELSVLRREVVDREVPVPVVLGVALPKGDRQKWLVEKVVELGATRVVPLITARSVAEVGRNTLGRLRRSVIDASKQCGRNQLMEIAEAQPWEDFVGAAGDDALRWLAHVGGSEGDHPVVVARELGPCARGGFVLAVGPEGGFAEDEVARAIDAGWKPIGLGPRILRVETAALLMVGLAAQLAGSALR